MWAWEEKRTRTVRTAAAAAAPPASILDVASSLVTQHLSGLYMNDFALSGKTAFLFATLPQFVQAGERVVVASGSTAVLDIVQRLVRCLKLSYARIDGKTHADKRKKAAKAFAAGTGMAPNVLLLSARAGGAGLNLQGASVMILTEPDWNPAVDEQTMARIWRTGQGRRTRIYRLVAAGTLEETILARQSAKLSLWRAAGVGELLSQITILFYILKYACVTIGKY